MWVWLLAGFIVLVQSIFNPIERVKLNGYEPEVETPSFSYQSFAGEDWQNAIEKKTASEFGFREWCVRAYNQVRYSIFNEPSKYVEVGAGEVLYERVYRQSVCGENYLGLRFFQQKIDSLKRLDTLLLKHRTKLVVAIAPNKYRIASDAIDLDCQTQLTNLDELRNQIDQTDLTFIDFNEFFNQTETEYPLMSKSGTHWSFYGATLAAQFLHKTYRELGMTGSAVEISAMEIDDSPRETDKDLHDLLNVMTYPPKEKLAYPSVVLMGYERPRVLVIGDSYYHTFYRTGIHHEAYHPESKLFYYNREVYHQGLDETSELTQELFEIELKEADIVLIMTNEDALTKFGWGFLTQAITTLDE